MSHRMNFELHCSLPPKLGRSKQIDKWRRLARPVKEDWTPTVFWHVVVQICILLMFV